MKQSMETYVQKCQSDVEPLLNTASNSVSEIVNEYTETKNVLSGVSSDLDSEILTLIEQAKSSGKDEAAQDINAVKNSTLADAQKNAENIKKDVSQKITDNTSAINDIRTINSKYGTVQRDNALSALNENNTTGNDLLQSLEQSVDDVLKDIDQAVNGL